MTLRRSCFLVPGNNRDLIRDAVASPADCIVFDLEDSVPVSQKSSAREQVGEIIRNTDFGRRLVAVRINAINTEFAPVDIRLIAAAAPHEIVIPKVKSADDVKIVERMIDAALNNAQPQHSIGLQALIETAYAVEAVHEISHASRRLTVLQFGRADFFADIGAGKSFSMDDYWSVSLYPRSRIVVAATAAGLEPVDTVFPNIKDIDGLKEDARRAAGMGFRGKWVVHPSQVAIVNEIFTPTRDEIRHARKLVAAYDSSQMAGEGAITVDDMLVDKAAVTAAQKLKNVAEQLNLWNDT
ncbi:MAG: CoA ester lyase [Dehalococcoidia bacterium]